MKTRIETSVVRLQKQLVAKSKTSAFATMLIAAAFACFAVSPAALARPQPTPTPTPTPTPAGEDRGNGNSAAERVDALNLNTTGQNNTAHGWHSLAANTGGSDNTANGFKALFSNTAGFLNTATGSQALFSNTSGTWNNAVGGEALFANVTGEFNNAVGGDALYSNTTGQENTAMGDLALANNTTGSGNVAIGSQALASSTAVGYDLGNAANVAIGYRALTNTNGTGWGHADANTAVGDRALEYNTDGASNSAFGAHTLNSNTTGQNNIAVGAYALYTQTTGNDNIAIGNGAGWGLTTGRGNIYIGDQLARDPGEANHTYIRNIGTTSVSGGGAATVTVDAWTGLLGILTSSRRDKEDIKAMEDASETLYRLKPVTYHYKKEIDRSQALDYGLIAEDVADVDPNLAVRNGDGQIETVRYNAINIMLLNEFLKEHKAFVEQQEKVKKLEAGLAGLLATVKEQAAQIEKVSAQLQSRKPLQTLARNLD